MNTQSNALTAGKLPPLHQITRPTVTTEEAAYYLNRKPQTLRAWACLGNGPLHPVRINGRLAWHVAEIRALVGGAIYAPANFLHRRRSVSPRRKPVDARHQNYEALKAALTVNATTPSEHEAACRLAAKIAGV